MPTLGRRPPEEAKQNGHLPPSTIAAQIVDDHLTQGRIHPKHQDREKFRRLLREILHTDENSQDSNRLIETNSDVNCRLIYVVIRAGLELSLNEDPFEKKCDLITQALESLSVVELTLQRCSDVLFSILEGRDSDPHLDGPLFLWLLPRLFIILGRSHFNEIHLGILNVMKTILITERKCRPQKKPQLVLQYMQGCIKGRWGKGIKESAYRTWLISFSKTCSSMSKSRFKVQAVSESQRCRPWQRLQMFSHFKQDKIMYVALSRYVYKIKLKQV